jgi:TPR repeat protein
MTLKGGNIMRHKIIIPLLLFSTLCLYPTAQAGNPHLISGTQAYERGDYQGAIHEYVQAGPDGQYVAGMFYYNGSGVRRDLTKAAFWFKKAAEEGNSGASYILGTMYEDGIGVDKDKKQAAKWYHYAANSGDAKAAYRLGYLYKMGNGVTHDHQVAATWFRKAAKHGNASAAYSLAMMREKGDGIKQDHEKAAKWFRVAAEKSASSVENSGIRERLSCPNC